MTTTPATRPRLAVLIDAENASAAQAEAMMAKIASSFGKPTVRRAYGDWTTPQLTPWKKVLGPLGIRPHQQFHSMRGKNTSDFALVMDAMDLIHERCVDGFCIVSSDGDFIGLASRIQAAGLLVYGFGQRACTLAGFARACDEFVFLEDCQPTAAVP
jgi:hypothetical protein